MLPSPPHPKQKELLSLLGELLVRWNEIEEMIRLLITRLARGSETAIVEILTAHAGSVSLCNALRTLNNEFAPADLRDHVDHMVTFFERTRDYRNYYAHSLIGVSSNGTGFVQSRSAKSRLVMHQHLIGDRQLKEAIGFCVTLHEYLSAIVAHFMYRRNKFSVLKPPRALSEKPPWPDRLEKPRLYLLDTLPPPPASLE